MGLLICQGATTDRTIAIIAERHILGQKIILDNAVMLVSLEDELDESMKELIKTAIPDLITETPATPIAIAKYKKGIKCAGDILKNSMRQLLIDVVSETVKKSLFQ